MLNNFAPLYVNPIHFNFGFSGTLTSLFVLLLRAYFFSIINIQKSGKKRLKKISLPVLFFSEEVLCVQPLAKHFAIIIVITARKKVKQKIIIRQKISQEILVKSQQLK